MKRVEHCHWTKLNYHKFSFGENFEGLESQQTVDDRFRACAASPGGNIEAECFEPQ
jgi:hypothetical protein